MARAAAAVAGTGAVGVPARRRCADAAAAAPTAVAVAAAADAGAVADGAPGCATLRSVSVAVPIADIPWQRSSSDYLTRAFNLLSRFPLAVLFSARRGLNESSFSSSSRFSFHSCRNERHARIGDRCLGEY